MDPSLHAPHPMPPPGESFSQGARFHPYTTTKHRITKGRYTTAAHPRGYIPAIEYPLNNQWIMMDVDDGYVLWTGIWKALGNSKADIVKMIESQPDLAPQLRRVRGGYLKIQGTWMPYEVALKLARRVAWTIREDLVPLFGPTFPSTCLSPDQPGYGQVLDNPGRRKSRRVSASKGAPMPNESPVQHGQSLDPSMQAYPYAPAAGQGHQPMDISPYPAHYASQTPPAPYPSEAYTFPPAQSHSPHYSPGQERPPRARYSPYPSAGPSNRHSHSSSGPSDAPHLHSQASNSNLLQNSQGGGYNLPPLASIGLESGRGGYPSLPPISSLREGLQPEMDASAVLRRLRIDDGPGGADPYRPSEEYLGTRRRSSSAPPAHLGPPGYGADAMGERPSHSLSTQHERSRTQYDVSVPRGGALRYEDPRAQQQQQQQHPSWSPMNSHSPSPSFGSHREYGSVTDPSPVSPSASWSWSTMRTPNAPPSSHANNDSRWRPQPHISGPADWQLGEGVHSMHGDEGISARDQVINLNSSSSHPSSGHQTMNEPHARAPMRPW